jgi:hypothetical protein
MQELLLVQNQRQCDLMQLCLCLEHVIIYNFFDARSFFHIFFQHLINEYCEFNAGSPSYFFHLLVQDFVLEFSFLSCWEWVSVTTKFVEHDTQRPDVGCLCA